MNKLFIYTLLVLMSDAIWAETLKSMALKDAEIFLEKGSPYASSYYHDSKSYQLGSREGYPGVDAEIIVEGIYKYMLDGEWVQEAIGEVEIDWGDGKVENFSPDEWPLVMKHKYGYDEENFRVTISEPKEFIFEIRYTTDIGNEYTQVGKYNISLDQNGGGRYSKASRVVEHYWYDSDCQMINGLCYKGEEVVYETEKVTVDVDLDLLDYFYLGGVSYFSGVSYEFKDVVCRNNYIQNGDECYMEVITRELETYPALTFMITSRPRFEKRFLFPEIKVGQVVDFSSFKSGNNSIGRPIGCKRGDDYVDGFYDESVGHYVVDVECATNVEIVGCEELGDELIIGTNGAVCNREREVIEVFRDDFFETCYPVVNSGEPNIKSAGDGYVIDGTDFSCYESIRMENVCYLPYMNNGDLCMYSEVELEYYEGFTNDNNPKDTYIRD